ncbi:MAG: hypothetical protein FWD15_04150 [Alphaproteobacteria bacterium]|nr:hypothetical protein [Alphaproteobacteria bacterium]
MKKYLELFARPGEYLELPSKKVVSKPETNCIYTIYRGQYENAITGGAIDMTPYDVIDIVNGRKR